ncbi:MAG: SIMPL domain-containing protein [Patescibacteria group bacterium]|nr:SIMPL domain-containing protein [Patescibacteria group bacterium]
MPVKKSVSTDSRKSMAPLSDMSMSPMSEMTKNCGHGHLGMGHHCKSHGCHFSYKLLKTFFGILLVYVIILVGSLIRNEIKKYDFIGVAPENVSDRQLNISAEGKVDVKPDVSQITVGNSLREATSVEATTKNDKLIADFVNKVKALGIDVADIKTESQIMYPEYNYKEDGTKELVGYNITQNVTVKVRNDVNKASQVVALAGQVGLNTIGGVESVIDDTEIYLDQARQQAVKKAQAKAKELSKMLGVQLIGVISYNEYVPESYPMYDEGLAMKSSVGMGGGPTIEPGTSEVTMNVNITYRIQ